MEIRRNVTYYLQRNTLAEFQPFQRLCFQYPSLKTEAMATTPPLKLSFKVISGCSALSKSKSVQA